MQFVVCRYREIKTIFRYDSDGRTVFIYDIYYDEISPLLAGQAGMSRVSPSLDVKHNREHILGEIIMESSG